MTDATTDPRRPLRTAGLALLLLALVPAAVSLATKRQALTLGGLTDNWIYLGANLRVAGVLGEGTLPMVLRAPGYPLFVAALFAAGLEKPPLVTYDYLLRGAQVVYAAQALLLALSGLLLFLWLASFVSRATAFAAGLFLATNPHAVVLVGLVHYSVLHILLIVGGGFALSWFLSTPAPSGGRGFAVGLLWGLATLVRSTSLLLPPFVLALCLARWRDRREALRAVVWFCAGMALAVAPQTIRNWRVAGRFIPVNLQAGAALWGSTLKVLPGDPDSYHWYELSPEFMRVYSRVTGKQEYDYVEYAPYHVAMEDAMRSEALERLRSDPRPYLRNALHTLRALCLDTSSILIRVFRYSQPPRPLVDQLWFHGTAAMRQLPAEPAASYVRLGAVLTLFAWLGVAAAIRAGDTLALAPAAIFGCLAAAHALTYMDVLYYYVRLPFVAFLAFYGLERAAALMPASVRPRAVAAAPVVAVAISGASLLLTGQLLLP